MHRVGVDRPRSFRLVVDRARRGKSLLRVIRRCRAERDFLSTDTCTQPCEHRVSAVAAPRAFRWQTIVRDRLDTQPGQVRDGSRQFDRVVRFVRTRPGGEDGKIVLHGQRHAIPGGRGKRAQIHPVRRSVAGYHLLPPRQRSRCLG